MEVIVNLASDNYASIHPRILKAISNANKGPTKAYGNDDLTQIAIEKFKEHLGNNIEVFFLLTGTGANVLGLKAATEPFNSIICTSSAHLNVDECGAPEWFTGCKLLPVPTKDGKLSPDLVEPFIYGFGDEHHAQPKVISITQPTEFGTVYTQEEIKDLSKLAHKHKMLLHMDGARIANAIASLGLGLREITSKVGVDILSFGGTKNGLMLGEAVVFFNKSFARNFKFIRKQGMQLLSKMRFISAQFIELLSNNLWLKNARHANKMAELLRKELEKIPQVKTTQKVESNAVFSILPKRCIPILQKRFSFYVWNEKTSEVRLMTSFETTKEEIIEFVRFLKKVLIKN